MRTYPNRTTTLSLLSTAVAAALRFLLYRLLSSTYILENFLSRCAPFSPSFTLGINFLSFSSPRTPLTCSYTLPPPEENWWWGSLVLRDQSTQSFGRVSVPAVSRFGVPVKGLKRVNIFKTTRCRYYFVTESKRHNSHTCARISKLTDCCSTFTLILTLTLVSRFIIFSFNEKKSLLTQKKVKTEKNVLFNFNF